MPIAKASSVSISVTARCGRISPVENHFQVRAITFTGSPKKKAARLSSPK